MVACAPHKMIAGVKVPGTDGLTHDFRYPRGSDENAKGVEAAFANIPFAQAMALAWTSDAHCTTYTVERDGVPLPAQPRVNKQALWWMRKQGFELRHHALWADIDLPDHDKTWRQSGWIARTSLADQYAYSAGLVDCWLYFTAKGLRAIRPLATPVLPEQYEALVTTWYADLEAQGIKPDGMCRDWTRLYRLPNVIRQGDTAIQRPIRDQCRRVVVWDNPVPDVALVEEGSQKRKQARRKGRKLEPLVHVRSLDSIPLERAARAIAEAMPARGAGRSHDLALRLAGWLVRRPQWVPIGHVVAMVERIASLAGWGEHGDRRKAAQTTVERYHQEYTVRGDLPPDIDRACQAALDPKAIIVDKVKAARMLREAIGTGDDVTLIKARCGTGKTRQTEEIAAAAHADGVRTVISVPTNALAKQIAEHLRKRSLPVLRYFGPTSARDEEGKPLCHYHPAAMAIASAGLSVQKHLCHGKDEGNPRCDKFDGCEARQGAEGDSSAKIIIGNHGLLGALLDSTGARGRLVIDEPPPPLGVEAIRIADLESIISDGERFFAPAFAFAFEGALRALAGWAHTAAPWELEGAVVPLAGQHRALDEAAKGKQVPPLRMTAGTRRGLLFTDRDHAAIERVGRIACAIMRAAHESDATACTYTPHGRSTGDVHVALVLSHPAIVDALQSDVPVALMAADIDLIKAPLEALAGKDLPLVEVAAPDGCEVRRVHIECNGSRARWGRADRPKGAVPKALAMIREHLGGDAKIGLITFKALAGSLTEGLADISSAHYGALRGLDHWSNYDAVVTVGDPRPNLDAVRLVCTDVDANAMADQMATAELEQAHGRLRTVHRDSDRPAMMIHIGALLPRDWPVEAVEVVDPRQGAPKRENAFTGDVGQLRALIKRKGGRKRVSAALGMSESAVGSWSSGRRTPTGAQVALIAALDDHA